MNYLDVNIENYLSSGFWVDNNKKNNDKIQYLRDLIISNLNNSNEKTTLYFNRFNEELRLSVLELFNSISIKEFLNKLSLKLKTEISILPIIHVMKNYHVNRLKTAGIGWHRDCGGEFKYKYCNNLLSNSEYAFGKIGIYLQNNSSKLGGGIDLVPRSHIYIKNKSFIKRKISGIRLKIIQKLQRYFPSFYKLISENFYIFFLKGKKINSSPGSPVFFDSRIVHRGSPMDDYMFSNVKEIDNIHYELINEDSKISIYCQFGSAAGVASYLYDRSRRKSTSDELNNWIKEIELYKKYSPELYLSATKIMNKANFYEFKEN